MPSSTHRSSPLVSVCVAAAISSTALAQWSVTVLEPATPSRFARANAVYGSYQGGYRDDGLSVPRLWTGSAASGITLAEPGPDAGSDINALTATHAFGEGFVRTSQFDGYYAALLWDLAGGGVTAFPPPAWAVAAYGYGAGGDQQVGVVEDNQSGFPVLWRGTPQSLVNLLPDGASYGAAYGTDGVQQVGFVELGSYNAAALWTGTAASFVNLHPGGTPDAWINSSAAGVSAGLQVGSVRNTGNRHAAVWQGTAASFVDIHPPAALRSRATGVSQGRICGYIEVPGPDGRLDRAAYWSSPSPAAFVDLHALLPAHYLESAALSIWSNGAGGVRIVGTARNTLIEQNEAVMWTNIVSTGACCNGAMCSVMLWTECTGAFQGAETTCGPLTCCGVPIGALNFSEDCDGDLLVDSCTPGADCNASGTADVCETLQITTELFNGEPSAYTVNGNAFVLHRSVLLTDASPGRIGSIVRFPLTPFGTGRLRAIFDFRISYPGPLLGDGFSFALMDAGLYPREILFGEDGPVGNNVITVKFNTYANDPAEGSNSMFIRYNGVDIAQNTSLPFTLADGQWHRAIVELSPAGQISVDLATHPGDLAPVFSNVQLPGYTPFAANIGFGARTGDAFSQHEIANIRVGVNNDADMDGDGRLDVCDCPADFNQSGVLSVQDIFDFLAAYFANEPRADFNGSGGISVQDIFDFLAAYFAGCA